MEDARLSATETTPPEGIRPSPLLVTRKSVGILALAALSIVVGVVFLMIPDRFQLPMVFVFPAGAIVIWILMNPWIGIYLFYFYSILRPYDFIPALLPLRLSMVLEIVTLISWVFYLLRTKKPVNWSLLNWGFLGFLGVMGVGVATADNHVFAYNTFEPMLITFIMFFIATNVVDSLDRLMKLIWLVLLIHLYFALRGIYNFEVLHTTIGNAMTSGEVGSGFIGDENDFALALNTWLPFGFFMIQYFREYRPKWFGLFLVGTFVWAIVSSMSRGGLVALVAVSLFYFVKSPRKLRSLAITLVAAAAFVLVAPPQYWAKLKTTTDYQHGTAAQRIQFWKAAFRMYADHPILGVGPGNGGIHMPEYIAGVAESQLGRMWGRAFHGTIPQVAAELGSVGLFSYCFMVVYAIKQLRRVKKAVANSSDAQRVSFLVDSLTGGILAYFVSATFVSTVYYPQLWLLLTFSMILVYVAGKNGHGSAEQMSPATAGGLFHKAT